MKYVLRRHRVRITRYVNRLYANPAKTILLSFLAVIIVGAVLFCFGFTAKSGRGLSVLDSLFTATSAVCVTGLAVTDTLSHFSFLGQVILAVLIQIGGLGIMILSFFTIFLVKRRVSLADKMLLSYMLSEDDTGQLSSALSAIVFAAFTVEAIGAVFLFAGFVPSMGLSFKTLWYSIFHSISAFCNAGFALFSDSLEGFRGNALITLTIAFLIILGGIGFGVISNLGLFFKQFFLNFKQNKRQFARLELNLNNRIVVKYTLILLVFGTILFYGMEFGNTMKDYSLGEQYLAAFFQSVTMRTAGFNSVPYGNLRTGTYIALCVFMFIGAASGSTGGGIKVNTLAALLASMRSYVQGEKTVHLQKFELAPAKLMQAFIIFSSGILALAAATVLLSFTETAPLEHILFEVSSAMGTVGVSAGLTANLSFGGKIIIMSLMFWGRLGALTMLSAAGRRQEKQGLRWPQADISIG